MKTINTWQLFAFASAIFAAMTAIFGKIGVSEMNSNLATFVRTIVILIVTALILTFRGEWERPEAIAPKALLFLVLSGLATGFSWLCYYRALQLGPASRVAPVDKLSVLFVMIFAFLFLKETVGPKEILGGALITAGAIFMVMA